MRELIGVFAPLTTPFDPDGALNIEQLASNMKQYAKSGLHGYLALGSNGESKMLTTQEKLEVVQCIAAHKAQNQVLIAGSIFESTRETINFSVEAQSRGADCIALLPPSYFKRQMTDAALIQYFTDVASALRIPCTLYKAPQYAGGMDISANVILECAKHPNIVGMKDSSSGGIERLLSIVPEEFHVMSGTANTFLSGLMNGATGGVVSLANYLPDVVQDVYNAFLMGDYHALKHLNQKMIRLNTQISGKQGVAAVKYAMDKNGFFGGYPRLPLLPLTAENRVRIDSVLDELMN